MNQNDLQTTKDLVALFNELAEVNNLSEAQKEQLFSDLEQTILLRITNHLLEKLPDSVDATDRRDQISSFEELFTYFKDKFDQQELRAQVELSITEVMNEFLDKI